MTEDPCIAIKSNNSNIQYVISPENMKETSIITMAKRNNERLRCVEIENV